MATYSDNLNGTAGDLLSARSGWSRPTGADNAQIDTTGSGVRLTGGSTTASGTWHVPTSQPAGNDQFVSVLIDSGTTNACVGVRCDTTVSTGKGYLLQPRTLPTFRLLYRDSAGGLSVLGSYTHGNSTDFVSNKVTPEAVGTTITVYFMGSAVIGPLTDANIASGSVAFLSRGGSMGGRLFDDMDWGDVGAGVTGQAKVWNGTAWAAKPVKVWNGSAWVAKPLKFWSGSSWDAA